jgi:Glyoxalase-like domain
MPMSSRIKAITIDCAAWEPLVDFWSRATRYREDPANPNEPGDPEGLLIDPDGGPALLFQLVPEEKVVKNRVHLDLVPDTTRDAEVTRLLDLGATLVDDHRRPDGTGWVTLADPGGNEFCVERSAAERA